jgi:hypothetical protein
MIAWAMFPKNGGIRQQIQGVLLPMSETAQRLQRLAA